MEKPECGEILGEAWVNFGCCTNHFYEGEDDNGDRPNQR